MRQEPSSKPLTVAIVEDHPEFRAALSQALTHTGALQLLEVCKDLPAGMALVQRECPDVLLVDLGLPSGSGLKLIRSALSRWGRRCTSAVLTVTGNEEHLQTAVAAGAKGYLFKSDQPLDWVRTVQLLAQGQSPLHAPLAQRFLHCLQTAAYREPVSLTVDADDTTRELLMYIAAGYTPAEVAHKLNRTEAQTGQALRALYDRCEERGPDLSRRELELLQLLDKGYPFKQCAELMGVSESTTKTQAARAYEKLGASNLQTALYGARQAGLLA
jgi:DNA-binding NarL/FixJ family response regulator